MALTAVSAQQLYSSGALVARNSGTASSRSVAEHRPSLPRKTSSCALSAVADLHGCRSCSEQLGPSYAHSHLESFVGRGYNLAQSGRAEMKRRPCTVCEIGGQYEESFYDVEKHMLNCFTFKAVRTVLGQLQETNPPQYTYLYNFVVDNKPQDGKFFIQALLKDRQELGERIMVQRLHLFNSWAKRYNHAEMYKTMSDQNLELLRERLIQTVKFVDSEDTGRPGE